MASTARASRWKAIGTPGFAFHHEASLKASVSDPLITRQRRWSLKRRELCETGTSGSSGVNLASLERQQRGYVPKCALSASPLRYPRGHIPASIVLLAYGLPCHQAEERELPANGPRYSLAEARRRRIPMLLELHEDCALAGLNVSSDFARRDARF